MKVLIVSSYREFLSDGIAPFVSEQCNALRNAGIDIKYFLIRKKGIKGYLLDYAGIKKEIKVFNPDIIHAHGGHIGALVNLQYKVPVVTSYHGSDINSIGRFTYSFFSILISKWNIFPSNKLLRKSILRKNFSIIPCGVNLKYFYKRDKLECRKYFNFRQDKVYILFSKAFHVKVKNYPLAKSAVEMIENAELVELHGYTREEVAMLMNACDVALMTSFTEGAPLFIKEAISCGCPVVSTNVGDVSEVAKDCESVFLCSYEVANVADNINKALNYRCKRNNNLSNKYDNNHIASQIVNIYNNVLKHEE